MADGAFAGDRLAYHEGPIRPDLLYHNYCSVCHGDRGDGHSRASDSLVPPPRDFTAPAAMVELNRDRMINSVTNGVAGTAMAGWKVQLNKAEIAAVVDYVRNSIMKPHELIRDGHGQALYLAHCVSCHGEDGKGVVYQGGTWRRGAPDITTPKAAEEETRDRMIYSVKNGRSGTLMVDFGNSLSDKEIGQVVDYMRVALMLPTVQGASGVVHGHGPVGEQGAATEAVKPIADMSVSFPDGLVGDANRGEAFYQTNCVTCHGAKGDGKGPRAYFINPRPRDFLGPDARSRLNRQALFEAISDGRLASEMPAWSKVIDKQKIADVAEYVFQQFIHPTTLANAASVGK
jgi:mono/diheme cytochrome c family protein